MLNRSQVKRLVLIRSGSQDETMFVTLTTFFSSTAGQGFENTK